MLQGLPHELHLWSPVVLAGPATGRTLALTDGTAHGKPIRSGTGAARVLSLTVAVGAGHKKVAAPAANATALPLTLGAGDGITRARIVGSADPYPLAGLSINPQGVKRANGSASPQAYRFPGGPANGLAAKRGYGHAFMLARPFTGSRGRKQTSGQAYPFALGGLIRSQKTWVRNPHREFCFTGLTDVVYDYMAAPLSRRFTCATQVGLTTWRDPAGWHSQYRPNPDLLADADVVLAGGRQHFLTDDLRASLTDAGLDPYITLQEVRP